MSVPLLLPGPSYNNSRLELNVEVEIKSSHHGPITWLDVDSAEERYLLTGEFLVLQEYLWNLLRTFFFEVRFVAVVFFGGGGVAPLWAASFGRTSS